jgi:hypothetical protein
MSEHPYRPTVHCQADLLEVWRHLMEPLGFGGHSVWMLRVGADRRTVPQLLEVTEADTAPDGPEDAAAFAAFLAEVDADHPGGSFAFLRSRPGRGIDAADRGWASFLYAAGRLGGVRMEVVHLATDTDLVPLPLDEVGVPRSA